MPESIEETFSRIESLHKMEGGFVAAPIKFVPKKAELWNFFVLERPKFLLHKWIFNYRDTAFSRTEFAYHEALLVSRGSSDKAVDVYVSAMFRAMRPSTFQKFEMRVKTCIKIFYYKMRY